MSADLRSFAYPLEALLQKQQWQLDAALSDLGLAQLAVERARDNLNSLLSEHASAVTASSQSVLPRLDPVQLRQDLAYLAYLNERVCLQRAVLEQTERHREEMRRACRQCQLKLELVERHRQGCLDAYREREQIRQINDADLDWLAHSQTRPPVIPSLSKREEP